MLFLLLTIVMGADAYAYEITVVKSDNTRLYNDALDGLKSSCNCTVHVIDLSKKGGADSINSIVAQSPDAVVAIGSKAYKLVKALKSLPLFTMLVYPDDPPRERNVWWVSNDIPPEKYADTIIEVLPRCRKVGLIINPSLSGVYSRELIKICKSRGLEVIAKEVFSAKEVPAALAALAGRIDMLVMVPDTTVAAEDSFLSMTSFSFQNNTPLLTFSRKFLEMGALASLEIDPFDIGKQTGELVRAVLIDDEEKPRVIYYVRKALLVINGKIAHRMGIRIPDRVLRKAEVLE